MRRLVFFSLFALLLAGVSQGQVKWQPVEQAAATDLKTNRKLFLIDFSTSWCGYCKKMDQETFTDPVVAAILNKYYIPVHFNAEGNDTFTWAGVKYAGTNSLNSKTNTPHSFTRAVLGQRIGYPSFAIFGANQSLVQILQGYQSAYDFSMLLWYFCSGDYQRYPMERYRQVFDSEIKPAMMKQLGLR